MPRSLTLTPPQKRKVLILLGLVWLFCVVNLLIPRDDGASSWKTHITPPAELMRAPYANWVHGHWLTTSMDHALPLVKRLSASEVHVDALLFQDDFFTVHNDYQGVLRQTAAALRRFGVHVVVVLDAIIPLDTPEIAFAKAQSFCVADRDDATYKRHIGGVEFVRKGCLINFHNKEAVKWFTRVVVKPVLQCGVEGLMLEPMVDTFLSLSTEHGSVEKSEAYSAEYYFSMFDFGRETVGFDFVAVFRAVSSIGAGRSMRAVGPQDVSFASQVGGGEPATFEGLQETALHLLHSADRGYINSGVSIPETFVIDTKHQSLSELFVRWAQLASATSLMKVNLWIPSGSNPWDVCSSGDRTSCRNFYRIAVNFHRSLRLYLHSLASHTFYEKLNDAKLTKHDSGTGAVAVSMKKIDARNHAHVLRTLHGAAFLISDPDSWDYMIGSDVFVAPVLNASVDGKIESRAHRHVTFPVTGQWVPLALSDASHHAQKDTFFAPKSTVEIDVGLDELLVFQRRGSVLPLPNHRWLPQGGVHFVIEGPQLVRRRPTMSERFIPSAVQAMIRRTMKGNNNNDEEGLDPEVAYVFGEHDHGVVLWYETRPATSNELAAVGAAVPSTTTANAFKPFMIDLVVTPYHRPIVIEIRRAPCIKEGCLPLPGGTGFHQYDSSNAFWNSGVRESGLRSVYQKGHDTLVFDPFSSLGNKLSLGPFVSL